MVRARQAHRSLVLSSCLAIAWLGLGPRNGSSAELARLCDAAKACPFPPGAPKASDVIMRSLTLRVAKGKSQYDTYQALSDFHVTRLEWTYVRDADFIAKVRASGRLFGGAAAAPSYVGDKQGDDWLKNVCILNREREVIIALWKRT